MGDGLLVITYRDEDAVDMGARGLMLRTTIGQFGSNQDGSRTG
jgi:hypothetical protein